MKAINIIFFLFFSCQLSAQIMNPATYLEDIKKQLEKGNSQRINLVFHGHSVPAGYFKSPVVNTLESYPYQLLALLKQNYPCAIANVIITAKSSENSEQGAARFEQDVLCYRPDVLFIDYALNDRKIGLERSKKATIEMVEKALKKKIKVILITSSPDLKDSFDADGKLYGFNQQIKEIAEKYQIGCANVFDVFKFEVTENGSIFDYMAQYNHPNAKGHEVIAKQLYTFFSPKDSMVNLSPKDAEAKDSCLLKVKTSKNAISLEMISNANNKITAELYDKKGAFIEQKEIVGKKTELSLLKNSDLLLMLRLRSSTNNISKVYWIYRN